MEILQSGGGSSIYLNHKSGKKCFFRGKDEICEFDYMQIDPATIKTGWGYYDKAKESFVEVWDKEAGSITERPGEQYRKGFSMWVKVDSEEEPLLWQRFSAGEFASFKQIVGLFWFQHEAEKPKLPVVKLRRDKDGQEDVREEPNWGNGVNIAQFDFVHFSDRDPAFVIPADTSESNNAAEEPAEQKEEKVITKEEIPF